MSHAMLVPALGAWNGVSLLLLRILIAAVFLTSGWKDLTHLTARAKSVELSTRATALLGTVEVVAAIALVLGIFVQAAALLLVVVMSGAIYKKAFVWHTGFWGKSSLGWFYDALYLAANLVLLTTGGGSLVLT